MFDKGIGACALWVLTVSLGAPVYGQDTVSDGATEASSQGADIVVQARKRAENVQDVSESITVATGEQLETLQITTPQDLPRIAPGLTYRSNPVPTSSAFVIRGIGTSTFSPGVEQSVSTVVDGVVLGQPQSAGAFIDIDHVEVLSGPQGTLFGKNASAGVINIITNLPRPGEFSLDGKVTVGTDGDFRTEAVLNAPLGSSAAVRLVSFRNEADGILDNRFRPEDDKYNNVDNFGFRARLLVEPSDAVQLILSADYARDTSVCCFSTARIQGLSPDLIATNDLYDIVPSPNNTSVALNRPNGTYPGAPLREYWGVNGQAEISLGSYTLTAITAYRSNKYVLDFDGDQTPGTSFDYNGGPYQYTQFSQELRLASPDDEPVSFLLGLFYFNSKNDIFFWAGGDFVPGLPPIVGITQTQVYAKSYAAFGNLEFELTSALRVRGGLRLTHDKLDMHLKSSDAPFALPGSSVILGGTVAEFDQGGKNTDLSGKVTVEFDLASDVMIYANAGRGYKGPGLSALAGTKPSVNQYVRPETVWAYDVGLKSQFLDRRVTLNLAAFLANFKDFQAQVYDTSVIPPSFRVTNAGKLRTKGVEAQISVRPLEDLSLFANGAYIDGEYRELRNISCVYAQTVPVPSGQCQLVGGTLVADASGNRLADSPRWTYVVGGDYVLPIGEALELSLHTDYSYQSDVQFAPNGDPNTIQDGYGIWNASIGLAPPGGRWELRAFVRNISDTPYADLIAPNSADTMGGYSQYLSRGRERQAGVSLAIGFR